MSDKFSVKFDKIFLYINGKWVERKKEKKLNERVWGRRG